MMIEVMLWRLGPASGCWLGKRSHYTNPGTDNWKNKYEPSSVLKLTQTFESFFKRKNYRGLIKCTDLQNYRGQINIGLNLQRGVLYLSWAD